VLGKQKENMQTKEKMTNILLPKGEWLDAMLLALKVANLELVAQPRSYEYSFVNQALPILFQAVRSKEIIETVYDWDTTVNAGFTGTDIAAEQGISLTQPRLWEFPIDELNPGSPKPRVYLGSTPNLRAKSPDPIMSDLEGTTIYTEYPNLTQKTIDRAGVRAKVKPVQGGSEGRWRIDQRNGAIVSIRNTDATLRANEIDPMLDIMRAGILYVESPNIDKQDQLRVDDLQELIFRALVAL
jgi:ATP phosphoribosyltransferase